MAEFFISCQFSRQKTLSQWTEWYKTDTQFFQQGKNFLFRFPPPQGIFALQGRDRANGVSATYRFRTRFGQTEMFDLAFPDQIADGTCHVLNGNIRIDTVLIKRSITSVFRRFKDASATSRICSGRLSFAIHAPPFSGSGVKPNLVADHELVTDGGQCLAKQFFLGKRSVDFGRIEKLTPRSMA